MIKRAGFTGTRMGMSAAQMISFSRVLSGHPTLEWLHHGNCQGADKDAHEIARGHGLRIKGHPPINTSLQAFFDFNEFDEVAKPEEYLVRDVIIVEETDLLIATPESFKEGRRSGTWFTIRAARSRGKRVVLVWPDGRIEEQ